MGSFSIFFFLLSVLFLTEKGKRAFLKTKKQKKKEALSMWYHLFAYLMQNWFHVNSSHAVLEITVKRIQRNKYRNQVIKGKLALVDLAGR